MDDEKPDTRHLVLKPKEIVLTEERALPGDGKAISVQLIHRQNQLAERKSAARDRKGSEEPLALPPEAPPPLSPVFKHTEFVPANPPPKADDEEAISVPEILLENRIAEDESGWGRIKSWKKRKSRRDRDFILLVGSLDLAIVIAMKYMDNTVSSIFGIAAITLVTTMFAWVMFVVNDDY
jgi:hypothetical protein